MSHFGLARLGISYSSEAQRNESLRTVLRDADGRFSQYYQLPAGVAIGAVAEEIGFPDVARRFFAWTTSLASSYPEDHVAAERAHDQVRDVTGCKNVPNDVLGFVFFLAGRFDQARSALASASSAAPADVDVALHLARTQIVLGEPEDAVIRTLEPHAAVSSPRQDEVRKELASALFRSGDARADRVAETATQNEREGMPEVVAELEVAIRENWRKKLQATDEYIDRENLRLMWRLTRSSLDFLEPNEDHISFVHELTRNEIRQAIRTHPGISTIIEFGVFCGRDAFLLSGEFPHISYVGVDRSPHTKADNDEHYQRPNLRFEAVEIVDLLAAGKFAGDILLVHARTAALLYPAAIKDVYAAAARIGVREILAIEEFGINRATGRFIRFGPGDPPSTTLRTTSCYAHDYGRYLAEAGYRVTGSNLIPITTIWKIPKLTDAHETVLHATLRKR